VVLLRALGDVHGLVADALEIGHELEGGREQAEVVRDRLPQREDAEDERVDLHLVAIDEPVELLHLGGLLGRVVPERVEREPQASLAARAHGERVCAQLTELGFEVTTRVGRGHPLSRRAAGRPYTVFAGGKAARPATSYPPR